MKTTPTLHASADACATTVLQRAEQFLSGFEDDGTQDGVKPLLADLRALIAASAITIAPRKPGYSRDPLSIYSEKEFALTDQSWWYRMYNQRKNGWRHEPFCYFVRETRYDAAGGLWMRAFPAVIDDFGNLVAVQA